MILQIAGEDGKKKQNKNKAGAKNKLNEYTLEPHPLTLGGSGEGSTTRVGPHQAAQQANWAKVAMNRLGTSRKARPARSRDGVKRHVMSSSCQLRRASLTKIQLQ